MTDRSRSKEQLEQTFRGFVDDNYRADLEHEAEGRGWDPVAASAAIMARASDAVRRNHQSYFILPSSRQTDDPASGPVAAYGPLFIARTAPVDTERRIPAGTPLLTALPRSTDGLPAVIQDFVLAGEVVFPVGDLGPIETLGVATRPGNQGNVRAGVIVGFAEQGTASIECTVGAANVVTDTGAPDVFWEALVGRYVRFAAGVNIGQVRRVLSYGQVLGMGSVTLDGATLTAGAATVTVSEWAELGFSISQPEDFENGRHGTLDAVGRDRGMGRVDGESDAEYAYRLAELPDVVSPGAIGRICARILSPYQIPYRVYETREDITGIILDEAPLDVGGFDSVDDDFWIGSVLLNDAAAKRFFVIAVGTNANLGSYGVALDVLNSGTNAYDFASEPGDGYAVTYQQVIAQLDAAIENARGGGVGWRIVQDPELI